MIWAWTFTWMQVSMDWRQLTCMALSFVFLSAHAHVLQLCLESHGFKPWCLYLRSSEWCLCLWPHNSPWPAQIPPHNTASLCVRWLGSPQSILINNSVKDLKCRTYGKKKTIIIIWQRENEWLYCLQEWRIWASASDPERGNVFNCTSRDLFWIKENRLHQAITHTIENDVVEIEWKCPSQVLHGVRWHSRGAKDMRVYPTAAKVIAGESDSAPERSHAWPSWRKTDVKGGGGAWTCFQVIRDQCGRKPNTESTWQVCLETLIKTDSDMSVLTFWAMAICCMMFYQWIKGENTTNSL